MPRTTPTKKATAAGASAALAVSTGLLLAPAAQASNDTIKGGAGDDVGHGGTGQDTLHGGTGTDHMAGNSGDDTMASQPGDPVIVVDEDRHNVHDSTDVTVIEDSNGDGKSAGEDIDVVAEMM